LSSFELAVSKDVGAQIESEISKSDNVTVSSLIFSDIIIFNQSISPLPSKSIVSILEITGFVESIIKVLEF
jgi:hypothetical protein